MTTTLVRILVIFVMGAASSASPPRQTAAPAPGAGVIRGRVVTGDTSAPLRDVVVSLRPADQLPAARPGTGGEVAPPGAPATRPDPNGRFEFVGVAAGRYRIAVDPGPTAARYLPVRYPDPSAEDPAPLAISGDQVLDQIVIALPRAAAITGRIVDERGSPMALVTVNALESLPGERRRPAQGFAAGLSMRTDDNGSFRLFGLRPGEYILLAQPMRQGSMWNEPGIFAIGMLAAVYYPGTPSVAEAARIRVGPGDEHGPLEFPVPPVRLSKVRGVVFDPTGHPAPSVNVMLRMPSATTAMAFSNAHATKADGTFELTGVPPGEYSISIHRSGVQGSQFAWVPVAVADDVDDLVIRLQPGVTVKGQVLFEGQPPWPLPTMYVRAVPARPGGLNASSVMPGEDLSFTLEHQFGPTLVRADAPGWHLKSVLHGGRDITDQPTEFAAGGPPLQVLLTRGGASLTGIVRTSAGVAAEASLLLFSEDPALWHERASTTRVAQATFDGRYRFDGLRPGRYLIVATSRDESAGLSAPYLELLARHATPFVVGEAESKSVDLKRVTLK